MNGNTALPLSLQHKASPTRQERSHDDTLTPHFSKKSFQVGWPKIPTQTHPPGRAHAGDWDSLTADGQPAFIECLNKAFRYSVPHFIRMREWIQSFLPLNKASSTHGLVQ